MQAEGMYTEMIGAAYCSRQFKAISCELYARPSTFFHRQLWAVLKKLEPAGPGQVLCSQYRPVLGLQSYPSALDLCAGDWWYNTSCWASYKAWSRRPFCSNGSITVASYPSLVSGPLCKFFWNLVGVNRNASCEKALPIVLDWSWAGHDNYSTIKRATWTLHFDAAAVNKE